MECKVTIPPWKSLYQTVLIETSWNVKTQMCQCLENRLNVLIETSWNVKENSEEVIKKQVLVLIETSWNVKLCKLVDC